MGLIKNIAEKLKRNKEIILEDFDKNYIHNQKVAKIEFNKMKEGCLVVRKRPEVQYYIPDVVESVDELILDIMEETNSQAFSYNFGHLVTFVKLYALNYVTTKEGKTYKEIKYACERLFASVDCLNFNFLAHINCETDYHAEYLGGAFAVTKDSYASKLVKKINAVNKIFLDIAEAIMHGDNDSVFAGYENLCDKTLYIIDDKAEEIFGL